MWRFIGISSSVLLMPVVKEPKCSLWPQWRRLLTTNFISRGGRKNPNPQVLGDVVFALEPKYPSSPCPWAKQAGIFPQPFVTYISCFKSFGRQTTHITSQRYWRLAGGSHLFIFLKEWDENRVPIHSWWEAFCVCLCICV